MEATQESTQPYADPRRIGINNSGLLEQDLTDIICILHPNSMAAHEAVAATARLGPQHILQRADLEDDAVDTTSLDIALRLSSNVHDPTMGFSFGRNRERCDIILAPDDSAKRISNIHFRISLTEDGVIMLEDTSTNGTVVDNCRLRRNQNERTRMLQSGVVITVVTGTREGEDIKFIVREPSREGYAMQYFQNLSQYLERINRLKNAAQQPKTRENPSKTVLQWTLGANPYGMHWTGGSSYNVTGQIGKGAFATVYKLATKQHGTVYAAKELDKRRFMKNGILDQKVDNEMKIMRDLKHVRPRHLLSCLFLSLNAEANSRDSRILFNMWIIMSMTDGCISSWNMSAVGSYPPICRQMGRYRKRWSAVLPARSSAHYIIFTNARSPIVTSNPTTS
jgi:hypothetical protein